MAPSRSRNLRLAFHAADLLAQPPPARPPASHLAAWREAPGHGWPAPGLNSSSARSKLPVTSAMAVINRLPNEWPPNPSARAKPVLKQLGRQRFVVGQRGDAVAKIARRQHTQRRPQTARRAAVVGHRDDGGEIGGVRLQAAQQRGQASAAANGHDARSASAPAVLAQGHGQVLTRPQEMAPATCAGSGPAPRPSSPAQPPPAAPPAPAGAETAGSPGRPPLAPAPCGRDPAAHNRCPAPAAWRRPATPSSQRLTPIPGTSQRRRARNDRFDPPVPWSPIASKPSR